MSDDQNGRLNIDLTDLIETAHVKLGTYEFDLPADVPLALFARAGRAFQTFQRLLADEGAAGERFDEVEEEVWLVIERLMAKASPSPSVPVRQLFNTAAAVSLLGFLVGSSHLADSMMSLQSPTSTVEPSPSETS